MELCSNDHEQVAFVSSWQSDCPACKYAQEVRDEMQLDIDKLDQDLEDSQNEVYELEQKLSGE